MDCEDPGAGSDPIETEDHLLGGRVRFAQPAAGYRVAIDPVLLAASIGAGPEERILDAGCGTGAAALCLAARLSECTVVGVELDAELAALTRTNIAANGLDSRVTVLHTSFDAYASQHVGAFDQVMTNPPFYPEGRHTRSPMATKAGAHGEATLNLEGWIKAAAKALRAGGRLTVVHRADRLDELLAVCGKRFGAMRIFPLWPRVDSPAKRILLTAVKGRRTPPVLMPGLVLHEADGSYSAPAQTILRDAGPLDLGLGSA